MRIRFLQLWICLSVVNIGLAQVFDDFSDDDFLNDPTWFGDQVDFEIDLDDKLHLSATVAGISYLATENTLFNKVVWEFYLRLDFNPSASNLAKVYLLSDQADLEGNLNGYYLIIGDTEDEISLYKQQGITSTYLINGIDGLVASSPEVRIKVIRDQNGRWTLYHDLTGGSNYEYVDSVVDLDNDIQGASHFGLVCEYTVTRADKFYFDDIRIDQLRIDSVSVLNDTSVLVRFNQYLLELEGVDISNYSIPGVIIQDAYLDELDSSLVFLSFDPSTPLQTGNFQLEISSGLSLNATDSYSFEYAQLKLDTVVTLSENEILLDFNQDLDQLSAENTSNYFIDQEINQPSQAQLDPNDHSQVKLILNDPLMGGIDYEVSFEEIYNLVRNSDLSGVEDFAFIVPLIIEQVEVLASDTLLVSFNKSIDPVTAVIPANYIIDQGIGNPESIVIGGDQQSVYLVFENVFEESTYQLDIAQVKDHDGFEIESGSGISFSYYPIRLSIIEQVDFVTISLLFNQKVDQSTGQQIDHFYIVGEGNPLGANISSDNDSIIYLTYPELHNSNFKLVIDGIQNDALNSFVNQDTINFKFEKPTPFRTIQINEVMADFSPSVGLPEAEYVELYNSGQKSILLADFILNGELIPDTEIQSNGFLLLTDDSNSGLFDESHTIYLSSFDALTNSGDTVILRDQFGNLVDSISYSTKWYQDAENDDGGYSLEQINPNQECSDETNWRASENTLGGTPGEANSIMNLEEDTSGPRISSYEIVSRDSIWIVFDEPVLPGSVTKENVSMNLNAVDRVEELSYREILVILDSPLTSEVSHLLLVENAGDCQGNLTLLDSTSFYYDVTFPELEEVIILSNDEIGLKFHEPLNRSNAENENNYFIDQGFDYPSQAILQDSALNRVHLTFDTPFSVPNQYQLRIKSLADTLNNVIDSINIAFEFEDQVDSVYIVAANLINVQLSEPPLDPVNPTSFLISKEIGLPTIVEIDVDDPKLLRLGFDQNLKANTVYELYIKDLISAETHERLVTPSKHLVYDTRAPRISELIVQNDSQLIIKWDEPIDLTSAFSVVNYKLNGIEMPVDIAVIDPLQIKLIFESSIQTEEQQVLKVSGISDLGGNETGTISWNFIYDPVPPRVTGISLHDQKSLILAVSEKLDTSSVYPPNHYALNNEHPTSINFIGPDSLQIQLTFPEVPESDRQLISISGLADKYRNEMDSVGIYFNSLHPTVSKMEFLSDSVLEIFFNKEMASSYADKSNYQISESPISGLLYELPRSVQLRFDKKFLDTDTVIINFLNLTDLNGYNLLEDSGFVVFDSYFKSWELIDPKTLEISFGTVFNAISGQQFSLSGYEPVLVQLDGDDKSIIRLVFEDSLISDQLMKLEWQSLLDVYGRRVPDYHSPILIDKSPPEWLSIESDYLSRIHVIFNEMISSPSIIKDNFRLVEDVALREVKQVSDSSITLSFDLLQDLQDYRLIINGLSDSYGNSIGPDTLLFTYEIPGLPKPGDIIMTELMVDPSPSIGLPESEYVELFNNSDEIIRLSSLVFSDASKQVNLPEFDFLPGTYLVLSGERASENCLYVPGFPTLDNSADSLTIMNLEGEIIDQVKYTRDWYRNTEKDDGGFSLELINPESTCPGIVNWAASTGPNGGTPGEQNSIYSLNPDDEPPAFVNYHLHDDMIQVTFSEPVDSISVHKNDFVTSGLTISEIIVDGSFDDKIQVTFQNPPQSGILYDLEISGLSDCFGNQMKPHQVSFGLGASPKFNDLVITEIMADPEPVLGLPNSEYVEIYNRTEQLVSLAGVKLQDGGGVVKLPSITLSAHQYILLVPINAVDQFNAVDYVVGVPGWRSLNNEGELLAIFHEDELVFNLKYNKSWHTIENDGGVALEVRDINNPCAGAINWGSSMNSNGGTPGKINSIAESIPDNFGPELINLFVLSDTTIRLDFDEQLSTKVLIPDQIAIEPGLLQVSSALMDTLNRDYLLITLEERLTPNTKYTLTINQVADCLGNPNSANTLDFVLPEQADSLDIVINEVLFNPKEDGFDFVEIFNRSDKNIDIKGWKLGREFEDRILSFSVTDESYILGSGDYLALTADPNRVKTDYPQSMEDRLFQMISFMAYPNETAKIVLQNNQDQLIDAFEYHEDMHLSFLESVDGVSLERISFDMPTQDRNNWQSASATVGFATPGYQNSQFIESSISGLLTIEPKVFVPANYGSTITQDFTTINYQLTTTGQLANVNIYNRNGQLIKNIGTGISLASNGFLRWDGTTDQGSIASMGYYLVVFETYDIQGNRNVLKETVVVGR